MHTGKLRYYYILLCSNPQINKLTPELVKKMLKISVQLKSSSSSLFSQHCEVCFRRSMTKVRLGSCYEVTFLTKFILYAM
jgi:hypothetical protein